MDNVRVNGVQYDWASIEIKVRGIPYYGVAAINYSQTRERGKFFGVGKHGAPRGRGRGQYNCEASIEMWASSAQDLRDALLNPVSMSYGDTEFDVVVQYYEIGSNETPVTVELFSCVFKNEDASNSQGTDGLKETIGLDPMYIKKNGATLFSNDGTR